MLMNAWMMLVLMKCKCQMQCLTLGCYSYSVFIRSPLLEYPPWDGIHDKGLDQETLLDGGVP